jgi:hypothetical protein
LGNIIIVTRILFLKPVRLGICIYGETVIGGEMSKGALKIRIVSRVLFSNVFSE